MKICKISSHLTITHFKLVLAQEREKFTKRKNDLFADFIYEPESIK